MPRNKPIRRRRRRPQSTRSRNKIANVSSGIPRTLKRISGNPPVVNEVSAQTVKVCFSVNVDISSASAPFKVVVADTPASLNTITLTLSNSADTGIFYLDQDEIYQAAYVRVFGQKPTGGGVSVSTEMALQSVAFYGPLGSGLIKMGVDFGPGMPGAIASDSGTTSSRPVVKAVTPRLYWERYHSVTSGDSIAGFWLYGFTAIGHQGAGANSFKAEARVDCVVHMRRSFFGVNTAVDTAAKTTTDYQMS